MTADLTETLLALVPVYGAALVGGVTFLSCLALPMPASLAMLAGGAFAAAGDLSLPVVSTAALAGAIAGDQVGFWLGRRGGALLARASGRGDGARMVVRARMRLRAHAFSAVFLSRWLFSPLGPWVNFAAGGMGLRWRVFTLGSVSGEVVWVLGYVGLGWGFASHIDDVGQAAGSLGGMLAAGMVTAMLLRALRRRRRRRPADGG